MTETAVACRVVGDDGYAASEQQALRSLDQLAAGATDPRFLADLQVWLAEHIADVRYLVIARLRAESGGGRLEQLAAAYEHRMAVEATALLRTVMEQIDVAVFAFDSQHRVRMANRTGERLMGKSMEHMLGRTAEELSLSEWFGDAPRVVDITPAGGGPGRWEVRRTTFRLGGLPHDLLVLSDVGFIDGQDPRMLGTIAAVEADLAPDLSSATLARILRVPRAYLLRRSEFLYE